MPSALDVERARLAKLMPWLRPAFASASAVLGSEGGRFVDATRGTGAGRADSGHPLHEHSRRIVAAMPWLKGALSALDNFPHPGAPPPSQVPSARPPSRRSNPRRPGGVPLSPSDERIARALPWLRSVLEHRAAWSPACGCSSTGAPQVTLSNPIMGRRPQPSPAMVPLLEAQARAWREFTTESFRLWTQEGVAGPFVGTVAVALPPAAPKQMQGKDPSTPLGKQPPGVPWSKAPPPGDGALALDDPWDEPRTGVSHWEFSVMANGLAGVDILNERRREHGTAAELLRDAERLGIGWLRQLGDADAHLETMWKGCSAYADLDSADNYWRLASDDPDLLIQPGWRCAPGTAPTPAAWSPPAALPGCSDPPPDVCPTTGGPTSCTVPVESPAVLSDALMDVAAAAEGRGLAGVLPVLIGHGDRGETEEDPCVSLRYYDWEYVDPGGVLRNQVESAHFELHPVDDLLALTGGVNEDVLLAEFMRQLIGNRPGLWGTGTSLRYVQLGNEMVGTTCGAALGWLILRLSELADRCEPSLVRVFPGLASPSNRPDHPTDPVVDVMYLRRTEDDLNEVFYHIVRAALLVRVESGVAADATRFEAVMPGIERAWTADPSTSLWGYINHQLYTAYTEADLPSAIFPLDLATLSDALLTTLKEWCAVNLQAPFQVMDFHWYNSRGGPGAFLYLHTLPLLLNRIRFVMGGWWDGGGVIPVWCTETGISSDRNPAHVAARRAAAEDGAGDFFTCYAHVPSCANHGPLGGGPEPPDPMGADAAAFEYRIDPALVQALADLGDPADPFPDLPEHWPDWVFTSEFEQAVQMWSRLAMLAASGVEKSWWYANVVSETDQTGLPTEFYSFGLTEDFMVSILDPVDCADLDGDGLSDSCTAESEFTSVEYRRRSKKRAFCALKRWNQYLGRYRCARLLPRFDGLDAAGANANQGFYAVVFRIADDSAEHPFALVTWTDPQAISACVDPAAADPWAACAPSRPLIFVPADPLGARPRMVQTIPHEETVDPAEYDPDGTGAGGLPEIADPCLADGDVLADPGGEPGYAGAKVWRFGPDQDLVYGPAPHVLPEILGVRVGVHAFHPPVLTLLPPGELLLFDRDLSEVQSQFVLDAAALNPPECEGGTA